MWYRCETMRQSNQVEIASEGNAINCNFCEDMSKSKNANRVLLIIYLDSNVLFFCIFLVE